MIFEVEGRVTPKYRGYFVSFWKKVNGVNTPYNSNEVEIVYVKTIDGTIKLSKDYLLDHKILKTATTKGKLGFRIKEEDVIFE